MARRRTGASRPTQEFPLRPGGYFSTRNIARASVHDGPGVTAIRKRLGIKPIKGGYTDEVAEAVAAWQAEVELPVTYVVTREDWALLFSKGRSASAQRGVRAAQEADGPVEQDEAPEGS